MTARKLLSNSLFGIPYVRRTKTECGFYQKVYKI